MAKRLIAVFVIFFGASVAWMILGGTLVARTEESDANQQQRLNELWGQSQVQDALEVRTRGKKGALVPLSSSRVSVDLSLQQRRKGLLWYNLYDVRFHGLYRIRNQTGTNHLAVCFGLPSASGSYSDFVYRIGGREIEASTVLDRGNVDFDLDPGKETTIEVGYVTRGMDSWDYRLGAGVVSVKYFYLEMTTNFAGIDFPAQTLPPVTELRSGPGWRLGWSYPSLVTGNSIGMLMPSPLQPGPLAQRITFWAPVALGFYFFIILLIATLHRIDLHPMNYFFLACAFFAFHLLFAYLVDRIPIEAAFAICSAVSMFLTISYLRLVVGLRFAAVESGLAQLVYLVLFSYALFNEGWSGLTITIGAIVTLFVAMQLTGRIRWGERLATA
jgi:hypothetical protein